MCPSAVKETKMNVTGFEYLTFESDAEDGSKGRETQQRGAIINTLSHFNK